MRLLRERLGWERRPRSCMNNMQQLVFLRHGQTDWNAVHRTMGQMDIRLNRVGMMQALAARTSLRDLGVTSVWMSPLRRCQQSVRLALGIPCPIPVRIVPTLAERHWGPWQGQLSHNRPDFLESPPGAESHTSFVERIATALSQIEDDALPLIVAHSGVFRAISLLWDGMVYRGIVPSAIPIPMQRSVCPYEN